jgi:cytochrome b561/polyisoprenoid-binding protein YceI
MQPARYSKTAMTLHWLIAAALAFQFGLGEAFEHLPRGKLLFDTAQFHKSIGITILILTLIRIAVRFAKPRPAPLGDHGWAERLASITHMGLYAFMLIAPLSGWLMTTASTFAIPTYLFNVIPWPDFPFVAGMEAAPKENLYEVSKVVHEVISKLGLALFLLHVIGALRHQFLLKEPLIERMVPVKMVPVKRALSPLVGSALIVALSGSAFALMILGQRPGVVPAADAKLAVQPSEPQVPAAPSPTLPEAAEKAPASEEPKPDEAKEEEAKEEELDPNAIPPGTTPRWAVAPGGRLGFSTSWVGAAVDGRFGSWSGDIRFNPDALASSKIKVTIDLASVDTGDGERDSTLKGSDFFNTGGAGQAVWTSTSIRYLGGNRYRADGTLKLRGASGSVPLTFTLDIKGKQATARGTGSLNRLAFGVGQGDYAKTDEIPDAVKVNFSFNARRE